VTPTQGIVAPNSIVSVNVMLDTIDIKTLVARFSQGLHIGVDKFLVMECEDRNNSFKTSNVEESILNEFWAKNTSTSSQLVR
jgi:hypothetical protein